MLEQQGQVEGVTKEAYRRIEVAKVEFEYLKMALTKTKPSLVSKKGEGR